MEHLPAAPAPSADHITDRSMTDFRAAAAWQWRQAVLDGEVSVVELASAALTAAATRSGLGAFVHLDPDYALSRAEQLDRTIAQLRRFQGTTTAAAELSARAPLLGLPMAFKDLVPVAGMPLTLGTRALPVQIPAVDAPLARRLHRAGAVSIGKTQVPELGLHCYSENQIAAAARNPLDLSRTAGGSSGGSAAAVSAGILPFAPGSDGGGSVRIPAAACGLVGLKPGRGRLPDDDQDPGVQNLPVSGPLASSAEDAALLFDVMAGHRFTSPTGSRTLGPATGPAQRRVQDALSQGLEPVRVGVTMESPFSPELEIVLADDAVVAVQEGISRLQDAGHMIQGTDHCTGADRFWPADYFENFTSLWTSRLAGADFPTEVFAELEPLTQHYLEVAASRSAADVQKSLTALEDFSAGAEDIFGPWDVILTPLLASAPPEIGWFSALSPERNYVEQCRFTPYSSVVNVLGLPAVSVPVHTDSRGLSWSVQLMGKHRSEELLLALAAVIMRR